jgi:hypothetical protein
MLGSSLQEILPNMAANRAFFSQDALDRWLANGRVSLEGEVLGLLPNGPRFQLIGAVLFRAEVSDGNDPAELCGKVKTLAAIAELSGEHAPGSVLLGDQAYEVLDGFVADLVQDDSQEIPYESDALFALTEFARAG